MRIDAWMQFAIAPGESDAFGVHLVRGDREQYALAVSPVFGASITGPGVECRQPPGAVQRRGGEISLIGEYAEGDSVMFLTGVVNGRTVVTCIDNGLDSHTAELRGAGLWVSASGAPATVRVYDVTVTSDRD